MAALIVLACTVCVKSAKSVTASTRDLGDSGWIRPSGYSSILNLIDRAMSNTEHSKLHVCRCSLIEAQSLQDANRHLASLSVPLSRDIWIAACVAARRSAALGLRNSAIAGLIEAARLIKDFYGVTEIIIYCRHVFWVVFIHRPGSTHNVSQSASNIDK